MARMNGPEWDSRRVVHVTFGLHVGGQEKLLVEFARHAAPARTAPTFISLGHRGELAGEIESQNGNVLALGEPSGFKPGLILQLRRVFKDLEPAVVHTHDLRSLLYAAPAARLARVPVLVHSCHGRFLNVSTRQRAMARLSSGLLDRFVCVSDDVQAHCLEVGIAAKRLSTIPNGIDVCKFRHEGPTPHGPVVTVARLSPEKDVANLVRAASQALSQASDLRFEIAGAGRCMEDLRRLAVELGVADRVTFLGEVQDIPSLLSRASIFVLPSLSEGIPLTVLEAMAKGLPVIATRVGGLPEVVIDQETGLLVPPADSASLSQAILTLWRDPERSASMGGAGRARVERVFDVRRMVRDYEDLYRSIWNSSHSPNAPAPTEFSAAR